MIEKSLLYKISQKTVEPSSEEFQTEENILRRI